MLSANVRLESLEIYIANNSVQYQSNLGHKKTPFAILLHTPEPFLKECQILFEHFGLAEAGIQAKTKKKTLLLTSSSRLNHPAHQKSSILRREHFHRLATSQGFRLSTLRFNRASVVSRVLEGYSKPESHATNFNPTSSNLDQAALAVVWNGEAVVVEARIASPRVAGMTGERPSRVCLSLTLQNLSGATRGFRTGSYT